MSAAAAAAAAADGLTSKCQTCRPTYASQRRIQKAIRNHVNPSIQIEGKLKMYTSRPLINTIDRPNFDISTINISLFS